MNEIGFYKVNDPYGEFSNFAPSVVFLGALAWPTVEHYFQAHKFMDIATQDKIRAIESPMKAALEGRDRNNILRSDWEDVKDSIMKKALTAKFFQHHELKKLLVSTGDAVLIEDTTNDNYWANGGDGTGKNRLGELLMEVREELKRISADTDLYLPPWIAFPAIDEHDMFWSMGRGEDYIGEVMQCMQKVGEEKYKSMFPASEDWKVFYDQW